MDTHGNILKLSFLLSYLALLICVVSGIPFMTAVFRAVILMTVFSLMGYAFRWYLLHVVSGVQPEEPVHGMADEQGDNSEFEISDDDLGAEAPAAEDKPLQAVEAVEQPDEQP